MTISLADQTLKNYRILRRLGSGGMGTVYLARTLRPRKGLPAGTEVAVKVLHSHLANQPDILKRFQREAGLGLTIRHPRIMATHDVGSARLKGEPYHFIVAEYLDGVPLNEVLERDGKLSEQQVVSIGRQVAEGLEVIHARGVVHRDIKPSNLFLMQDGSVKVADLGLSRLQEPSTEISLPGTFLGSVAYAAPEQVEGDKLTPAADLYSLGVTLYELACGVNPFEGVDLGSTLLAHHRIRPVPLGQRVPECSYFLEQVIDSLLEKDGKRRLQPAGRLARILAEREQSGWWREMIRGEGEASARLGDRRQFKVRRAARLYGRDEERARLEDLLRTATVGRSGRMAVICGEAGSGKTRLIDAALEAGAAPGARLLVSRFLDLSTPAPYYPLNQALLAAFDLRDRSRAERQRLLPDLLRQHLPDRSVHAEAFAGLIEDEEGRLIGGDLPVDAITGLYIEVIRTLSVRIPLVLVIEELQWADRGTLRVLEGIAASLSAFPMAVILTTRPFLPEVESSETTPGASRLSPGEPGRGDPLERFFAHSGAGRLERFDLGRLDLAAVRSIIRDVGVPADARELLASRLHAASEGNPAFLFALVDDLRQRGKLFEIEQDEAGELPIPSSIKDFLEARLLEIDGEARRFLEFASVFGTRFKLEPVIEGLGIDLVTASEIVARLTHEHQLLRAFEKAYRFDHHLLRETVYRQIPREERRRLHGVVAGLVATEVGHPREPTRAAYEAGIHYSLAEIHRHAARYLVGAVRYLVERNQFERAERLALKAWEHLERMKSGGEGTLTIEEMYAVHAVVARVAGHLGRRDRQGEALVQAARIALGAGDQKLVADSQASLALHAEATGHFLAAVRHAEAAREAASQAGEPVLEAAALRSHAEILYTLGETDYDALLEEAEALSRQAGDESGRAYALLLLGQLYVITDRPSNALETLKEALALFESLLDERGRGRTFFQLARVYRTFGDVVRAEKAIDLARGIARANSDRSLLARCLYVLGELAMRRRRHGAAERLLEEALAELEATGDRAVTVYALIALALTWSAGHNPKRDPERGTAFAERAVRLAQEIELARREALAYAALAFTYLAQGRPHFALAVSKKGLRFLETHESGRRRTAEILFVHYRCLKALGRLEEARPHLRRAAELVDEQAAQIEPEALRRSFLENDPFNAALMRERAAS